MGLTKYGLEINHHIDPEGKHFSAKEVDEVLKSFKEILIEEFFITKPLLATKEKTIY